MVIGSEAYAGSVLGTAERAMRAECAALMREFPGAAISWTSMRGYRVDREGLPPLFCESRSAILCHLVQDRQREARRRRLRQGMGFTADGSSWRGEWRDGHGHVADSMGLLWLDIADCPQCTEHELALASGGLS